MLDAVQSGGSPCSGSGRLTPVSSINVSHPPHLRAEPVNLSFMLMPSVTAFATTSFDESKSRALRLDAFKKEVAP
jgi:hypothetical protein